MNKGEKLVHPRPRRWNCARQEYHWDSNGQNAHTRDQRKVFIPASVVQITQRWSWKKLLPFHCGQVVNPDEGEVECQVLFYPASLVAWDSSTIDRCLLHAIVVKNALSSPTRGSKSLGSATDANVTMDATRTCGQGYEWISTKEADAASHTPLKQYSILFKVSNGQLICISYVPKLKQTSPRARIVFSQGQVPALPRARFLLP